MGEVVVSSGYSRTEYVVVGRPCKVQCQWCGFYSDMIVINAYYNDSGLGSIWIARFYEMLERVADEVKSEE